MSNNNNLQYNSGNLDTDYINDTEASNQYNEDKKQHLSELSEGKSDTTNNDTAEPTNTKTPENKTTEEGTANNETTEGETADKEIVEEEPSIISDISNKYLTTSNMFLLLWFLAIYIVVYYVLGMFFNKGSEPGQFQRNLGRTLDFIFFISIFIFSVTYYTSKSKEQIEDDMRNLYESVLTQLEDANTIIATSLFIISLYIIVYLFRVPMSYSSKPFFISLIENTAWFGLILSGIVVFIQKVFDVNILDYIRPSEEDKPEEQQLVDGEVLPQIPIEQDEVFNIADNKYSYEDAQAVCSSFGAKLATYDQIESAYNNGAEWCNYGWSDGQMAFFPTQKDTWDKLQKFPKKKNNCGRPGVNGGYIDNPYIKFGVNCYGKKPKPTENDLKRLETQQEHPVPLTAEDKELQKKINYWKENSDKLKLNSFNNNNWSRY
jgi:hypothetical protein